SLTDNHPGPGVSDENDGAILSGNGPPCCRDVIRQRGKWILYRRHMKTLGLKQRNDFGPARPVRKGPMDKDDVLYRLRRDLLSKALECRECKRCHCRHA